MAALSSSATLLAFPGAVHGAALGVIAQALKAHRVPELLAAQLLRAAAGEADPHAALTRALAARMTVAPLALEEARAILLIGAKGAGKTTAAAAIAAATTRPVLLLEASEGLARLKAGTLPQGPLMLLEAEGFHPLNPRARSAFAALNDVEGVEPVGVVSAAADAQDVGEMVAAFRFRRLIVTGLDRTRRLGALVAAMTGRARLAHLVRAGRLENLDPAGLAAALLAPV